MVICLVRGADCFHIVQLMPLHPRNPSSLASYKSRLVVLKKRPLKRCGVVLVVEVVLAVACMLCC